LVRTVTSSPLALTLAIPVATCTLPEAVDPLDESVTVGCAVTLTPVNTLDVVGVPKDVMAAAESPIVTPVTIASPLPVAAVAPVAAVIAVPRVTFEAVRFVPIVTFVASSAVPSVVFVAVTSLPFPPPIISVSAASPLPIENVQVDLLAVTLEFPVILGTATLDVLLTFGIDTLLFPVTFGIVVVTNFLFVSAETDLTNVSVVCAAKPVIAEAVPSAPTATPVALAPR
jgi:hypothetical protein